MKKQRRWGTNRQRVLMKGLWRGYDKTGSRKFIWNRCFHLPQRLKLTPECRTEKPTQITGNGGEQQTRPHGATDSRSDSTLSKWRDETHREQTEKKRQDIEKKNTRHVTGNSHESHFLKCTKKKKPQNEDNSQANSFDRLSTNSQKTQRSRLSLSTLRSVQRQGWEVWFFPTFKLCLGNLRDVDWVESVRVLGRQCGWGDTFDVWTWLEVVQSRGPFLLSKRRQLGGGEWWWGKGGKRNGWGIRARASHCQTTALATSFEILSTHPLLLQILKENGRTAAQKMQKKRKKERNNNKKRIKGEDSHRLPSPGFME